MAAPTTARNLFLALSLAILSQTICAAQDVRIEIPGTRLITYRYELTGEDRDDLFRQATVRAVESAAGRIYFSDYLIRGRRLLAPYIGQHWERFRAGQRIHADEVRGGQRYLDIEITVDQAQLIKDLAEKRFLYRPSFRPVFYIFMSETAPGGKAVQTGRQHILKMLDKRQYRYLWQGEEAKDPKVPLSKKKEVVLTDISPYKDPTGTPEALIEACKQAQRNEIEVFVTGSVTSTVKSSKTIYFDKYSFVETTADLKLVRADTGEVIAAGKVVRTAGHQDTDKARIAATLAALNEAVPPLFDEIDKVWGKMVLRKADMRVLIDGAKPETVNVVREVLTGARPDAEIYERGSFGEVAVLTVSLENGDVERAIRGLDFSAHPDITMGRFGEDGLVIQVVR